MRESNDFATQKGDLRPGDSNIETSETGGLRLNIRVRLAVILLIPGLIPLEALTYSLNQKIKAELLDINKNQLVALREEKKLQIESYFKQIESQIITFSNNHMIVNAMKEFKKAFFKVEKEYPPVDVMFLYDVINKIGSLADISQTVGHVLIRLVSK